MVGSILSNLWAALIAFTLYFGLSYPFVSPFSTLLGSFSWAILFFLVTFIIRYSLNFVLQSPVELDEPIMADSEQVNYSSEEMATVIKQMIDDKKT